MRRREALKGIFLFSLGTGLIYSCADPYVAVRDLELEKIQLTDDQLHLVDAISKIILPIQEIPALQDHTALPFVMNNVDDMYAKQEIDLFIEGADHLTTADLAMYNKKFIDLDESQKTAYIQSLNVGEEAAPIGVSTMFKMVKKESLKYLETTEYILRKVNYYEMAPGRYKGNVNISDLQNRNTL